MKHCPILKPYKVENARFVNKQGLLTPYAFVCGYVEDYTNGSDTTQIYRDGGCNFYHIRRFTADSVRVFWRDAKTLKEARKIARSAS